MKGIQTVFNPEATKVISADNMMIIPCKPAALALSLAFAIRELLISFRVHLFYFTSFLQAHPEYKFEYKVSDHHTGDHKTQNEHRDGDHVTGFYSLHEPDGSDRNVHYHSDKHTGYSDFTIFNCSIFI